MTFRMRMRCEKRWRSFSGGSTVIVDMSEAEFIDSTTLSVLIGARRQRYPIAVVAPSGTAAGRLAELVCLADMIPTYQTRAEALTDLAPEEELAAGEGLDRGGAGHRSSRAPGVDLPRFDDANGGSS